MVTNTTSDIVTLPVPAPLPVLIDQYGRRWEPWRTLIPGHSRCCARCGKAIDAGYLLAGAVRPTRYRLLLTVLCPQHLRSRWV